MMLGFIEKIDQLAMANNVCWYEHVLSREDSHILRRLLEFEGQRRRQKKTWKRQVEGCLCNKDELFKLKEIVAVNRIATELT